MSTNCVGTYEQYVARLLKMKPNVYLHGQKVDRSNGKEGAERALADWEMGGAYVMKQCYDTSDLSSCRRLHAALHGHRRHERPVLRHL